jgi:hypothetical protein
MNNKIVATGFGPCLLALLFATSASGQQRTFVSAGGSDANPCSRGLLARDGARVTVRNSVASANGNGFEALSNGAASVQLTLQSCVASNNSLVWGIIAQCFSTGRVNVDVEACVVSSNDGGITANSVSTGVATVRLSNSTVTDNANGLVNGGGVALVLSRGNNTVQGNTQNTLGIIGSYTAN